MITLYNIILCYSLNDLTVYKVVKMCFISTSEHVFIEIFAVVK